MPYSSTTNEQAYRIDTGENDAQREVIIEGTPHTIDWSFIAPLATDAKAHTHTGGRYSLLIGGKSYEIFAQRIQKPDENGSQTYEIHFAGQRFEVQVEDEREKALAGAAKAAHDSGEARVRAPMPGLVIDVPLEAGTHVERGHAPARPERLELGADHGSSLPVDAGRAKHRSCYH